MLLPDFFATLGRAVGVVLVRAGEVEGNRIACIHIRLSIRHGLDAQDAVDFFSADLDAASQKLVAGGVVALGFADRNAVGFHICEAEAEIVGLEFSITRAGEGEILLSSDVRQELAILPRRDGIIDLVVAAQEIAAAGEGFAVGIAALAAHLVGNAGGFHEVALVGGVDENLRRVFGAVGGFERADAAVRFIDRSKRLPELHRHFLFGEHFLEDFFGDMRLEHPGDFLPVVFPRAAEKFQREAADDIFLAVHVGAAEAAREHSSNMIAGFQ